jgi:transcriptional antiterminator NusG
MDETPIQRSDEAAPEQAAPEASPAAEERLEEAVTDAAVEEAVTDAAVQEAVTDAVIEEALEERLEQAVADAVAVEAASDATIQGTFEERVAEAVASGLAGEELADAVAQAAADADLQEAIADGAIAMALAETIEEAVEVAAAVEAETDAEIAEDLAERVEEIAERAEERDAEQEPTEAVPAAPTAEEGTEPAAEMVAEPVAEGAVARSSEEVVVLEEAPSVSPDEVEVVVTRDPFRGPGDWYVVHTYAGYENKVKTNLESRIHTMQMEDKIFDVHIPMEDVMEIKGGKKQVVQRKVFPGYLLVKMVYDNDSWYVVRNTPGVTGFVAAGTGSKPTPLSKREVEKILAVKKEEVKPQFRLGFEEGDVVRIIAGPFADFNGTISEINLDQSKLKVLVNIFDRETPVELSFDQVAKV